MLKRVDVAVYETFMDAMNGEFTPGFEVLGLAERGVGFAMDEFNADLVTPEMEAAAYKAAYDIATGAITVHDYMATDSCPY